MRVTFGRYIPRNSIIHRMDPRLKLFMIILLIVSVFFPIGFTGYIVLTIFVLSIYAMAKLSWRSWLTLLIPVSFIFIVIFIINIFLMHPSSSDVITLANASGLNNQSGFNITQSGGAIYGFISPEWLKTVDRTTLTSEEQVAIANMIALGNFYNYKVLWFSEKALYISLIMGWRIYLMITLTTILTGSTQPLELTLAIEDLLWPLKLIGIPIYILSMIISIALRMIPTLLDEAGRIMKAQASRGIDVKNGKLGDKAKGLTSLIIPLLVSSFQKAEDLAYAMDGRGYDPKASRTKYIQFGFKWVDWIIFIIGIGIAIAMIVYAYEFPITDSFLHIPYIDQLTRN